MGRRRPTCTIYTDGSCQWFKNPNKRHGGWAFIVLADSDDESNIYRSGYYAPPQTNQTMELLAVLEALRYVKEYGLRAHAITIHTDSMYVINGMTSQFRHHVAGGMEAPNSEIWLLLHRHAERCKKLSFRHVKGHAGDTWNEMCDKIAGKARVTGINLNRRKSNGT